MTYNFESAIKDYTEALQQLMQRVGISSFKALSRQAGVSEWQVRQLRRGQVSQMRLEKLLKIAKALEIQLSELLSIFALAEPPTSSAALQQECDRLLQQLEQQRGDLMQEFVQTSLQTLESWLVQWPTAAHAAQQKPDLPAVKLLPLLRPLEQLLQQWGVTAIAPVGEEIPYDPQAHQLMEGTAEPGQLVKVRYTGYRIGDKLLYRAKVSSAQNRSDRS